MINYEKVFMIGSNEKITRNLAARIIAKGYSRIPVYHNTNKNKVIGNLNIINTLNE